MARRQEGGRPAIGRARGRRSATRDLLARVRWGNVGRLAALLGAGLLLATRDTEPLRWLGAFAGPLLVLGAFDLRERAMLGDTGSNLLGALAGLWMVTALDTTGQLVALAALVALTASGAWPPSMVGLPGDRVSNMNPPSLCIVALTVWLVGLAMLLRPAATRWLERPRPWTMVVTAGSALMTLFLWHLTALALAVLLLHPLGLTGPTPGTLAWWALRPLWLLVPAAMLVPLVALFARFERSRPTLWPRPRPVAVALGLTAVVVGILGVAVSGIWPLSGSGVRLLALGVGTLLLGGGRLEA
jgi:hypothetical protein